MEKPDKKKVLLYVAAVLAALALLFAILSPSEAGAAVIARAHDPGGSGAYLDVTDETGDCPEGTPYVARMHEADGSVFAEGCWTLSIGEDGLPVSVDVTFKGYEDEGPLAYPIELFESVEEAEEVTVGADNGG